MATKTTTTRILGKDATSGIREAVNTHLPGKKLLLVCDENTWTAAGEKTHALLHENISLTRLSLGRFIDAKLTLAEKVTAAATEHDALIAVGSGTINDLTKYAATQTNKPYLAVATAASMNGYSSANASLHDGRHKLSYPAKTPVAVLADTNVLAAAPKRLTRAGLGDTLCRSTVEADMILCHYLFGAPYPEALFQQMRRHEEWLIANAPTAREGDTTFTQKLMDALLDAGDAMTSFGSSAPASQGEHMIAHTLDFMYGSELRNIPHGELIALTTLTVNRLQQKLLLSTPIVKRLSRGITQFELLFGKKFGQYLAEGYQKKVLSAEQVEEINRNLKTSWGEIKAKITSIAQAPNTIERAFVQSGLAVKPSDAGITDERYRFACTNGFMTRDRFTFLDIAAMNDKRAA